MKWLAYLCLVVSTAVSAVAWAKPDVVHSYKIDPVHTSVVFKINHLGFSNVYGVIPGTEGQFTINETHPEKSSVELKIDASKLTTMVQKRDSDVRGPDFLSVKQFPFITFKSTKVKKVGASDYRITGNLNMHGVTKPVTVMFKRFKTGNDPWGHIRTGGESLFKVKRSEFGMNYMAGMVGDEINMMISVEGVQQ